MTNRMSIVRELFPNSAAVDLYGNNTLSTSAFKEISPLDTSTVGTPSGKVYISSTSAEDDTGTLVPATAYVLTISIDSAATVVAGPKDILLGTNTGTDGTAASITDAMSANDVAAALRATTLAGYTITGSGAEVIVTCNTTGNSFETVSLDLGDDVTLTSTDVEVRGTFAGGSAKDIAVQMIGVDTLVAGTMTVQFNDELPIVPIEIAGTESASDIYDLIVAATPSSHTSINFSGQAVIITNNTPKANLQRIIIGPGATSAEVNVASYQDGINSSEVSGTGALTIEIKGITTAGNITKEIIVMNGQTQVESLYSYSSILSLKMLTVGTSNSNVGKLYVGATGATAGKPNTGYLMAPIGYNTSVGTVYTVPTTCESWIEHIDFFNPTASEIMTLRIMSDYTVAKEFKVGAGQTSIEFDYPVKVEGRVALVAKSASTTPSVTANMSGVMVKKA